MERITLSRWLADPEGVVRSIFAEGGPASARFPGYKVNPVQVDYAVNLAKAIVRGADPSKAGRVTLAEAGTATGKTLAILVVGMLNAVLRKRRSLVTSFTRQLNRQMTGKDGLAAIEIVEAATGVRGRIALRRPRTAFASPTACRNAAGGLEADANRTGNDPVAIAESAAALRALADWTESELARFESDPREAVGSFAGLVETFKAQNPALEAAIDRVPFEHYALDGIHPAKEQVGYRAYAAIAGDAQLLVATHAALVIDQSRFGGVLDPENEGFGVVVIDEANRLEDAGRAALGAKRSISVLRLDAERALQAIRETEIAAARRQEIAKHLFDHADLCERFLAAVVDHSKDVFGKQATQYRVEGTESWYNLILDVYASTDILVDLLSGIQSEAVGDLVGSLRRRQNDFETFIDCVGRNKRSKEHSGYTVPPQDRPYAHALVDFSPRRMDPSLLVVPRRGGRVVSRLWRDAGKGVRADAVVLTSATLAAPNARGFAAFRSMLEAVSLSLNSANVNEDLSKVFHLRKLGTMRELVLADPNEARPSIKDADDGNFRSPDWLDYVVDGIVAASGDAYKARTNRVMVLCTSFDEVSAIAEGIEGLVDVDVVARRPGDPLEETLDRFAALDKGILVVVGAWDGVDRPGLIDHLVIPRLPFPPPSVERKGGAYSWSDADGQRHDSYVKETMLRLLVQGLGRPFRVPGDEAKVWILDPRIGVPPEVELRERVISTADRDYLSAIPKRFADALDDARLFRRVRPRRNNGKAA